MMHKIRNLLLAFGLFFYSTAYAELQVSIGINVPVYPEMVLVPGYPVYYAPQLDSNYFFYDGLYWVFQDETWYQSSWYNGPWWPVDPEEVPQFILRVPVRYYRLQPTFFFGWSSASAPRWGEHWGHDWEQRRNGWDRWDHRVVNAPAPLPRYQRQYSGNRYPQQEEQQHALQSQHYRYQSHDPEVKQHSQDASEQSDSKQRGKFQNNSQAKPNNHNSSQQGRREEMPAESPQQGRESNPDSSKEFKPSAQDDRQKSIKQVDPGQSTSTNQRNRPSSPRPQPSQKAREDIQRLGQPSSQQRSSPAQRPIQEPRKGNMNGNQQNQPVQPQNAKRQRNNSQDEPKQEQRNNQHNQ
jgi:hypothetical protein